MMITDSKKELTPAEKLKFIDADGNAQDGPLVEAFPHMDMSGKDAIIADDVATLVPGDAVTASGSGLDPHISLQNAALQAQQRRRRPQNLQGKSAGTYQTKHRRPQPRHPGRSGRQRPHAQHRAGQSRADPRAREHQQINGRTDSEETSHVELVSS